MLGSNLGCCDFGIDDRRSQTTQLDLNHAQSARSHPTHLDLIHTRLDLIHTRLDLMLGWLYLIHSPRSHPHSPRSYPHSRRSHPKLWIEKTKELVVFETEISWYLKGIVAIAIATTVRKKSLAAVATAILFSETPPRRELELDRCSRFATPPTPALCSVPEFIEKMNWLKCLNCFFLTYLNSLVVVDGWIWKYTKLWYG